MKGSPKRRVFVAGTAVSLIIFGMIGLDARAIDSSGQALAADGVTSALGLGGGGKRLYEARCGMCHVAQTGPGTIMLGRKLGKEHALLTDRTDLRAAYVAFVVRKGLNGMPALTRVDVTDKELDQIAAYLSRNNPSR